MSPLSLTSSVVAICVALTLSVVTAYPTKDEEYYYNRLHELPDAYNKDVRNLDGIGGGNLLRDLDLLRTRAAMLAREQKRDQYHNMDPLLGTTFGGAKRAGCCDIFSGQTIGSQKRNMDEIDRSSFNSFVKKNFDEIDRSGFGSFAKRNFDEIDRSGFGSFVKRSAPQPAPESHN